MPKISFICDEDDGIGEAYVMDFIEGETIARKILRDEEFDNVRGGLPPNAALCWPRCII